MANVLLTEQCVRSCPYCFAEEHMDNSSLPELNWDDLIYIADFLELSGHKKISLLAKDTALLGKVVKAAFSQRRKTIQNSLKTLITQQQLIKLNIGPKLRAEQLSVDDFVKISNLLVC